MELVSSTPIHSVTPSFNHSLAHLFIHARFIRKFTVQFPFRSMTHFRPTSLTWIAPWPGCMARSALKSNRHLATSPACLISLEVTPLSMHNVWPSLLDSRSTMDRTPKPAQTGFREVQLAGFISGIVGECEVGPKEALDVSG